MDIQMPRMDGISATRRVKKRLPSCRVLMMTVLGEQEYVHQAVITGDLEKALFLWDKAAHQVENFIAQVTSLSDRR